MTYQSQAAEEFGQGNRSAEEFRRFLTRLGIKTRAESARLSRRSRPAFHSPAGRPGFLVQPVRQEVRR